MGKKSKFIVKNKNYSIKNNKNYCKNFLLKIHQKL